MHCCPLGLTVISFTSLTTFIKRSNMYHQTNGFETAHLQKQETLSALASSYGPNGARSTPELPVALPAVIIAAALAFFAVSFEMRIRAAVWRGATGSHPIPTAILAMTRSSKMKAKETRWGILCQTDDPADMLLENPDPDNDLLRT